MARLQKRAPRQNISNSDNAPEFVAQPRGCILFVDDDELIVQMGQNMLDHLGYEAAVRRYSLEALETFQEAPQRFDLVLTDLDMPHMTGDTLARQLRCIRPDIPIILCTGCSTMTREKAQRLGFDTLLAKPFGLHDIAVVIERVLTQRTAQTI